MLDAKRRDSADEALAAYDFGDVVVEELGGWERWSPGGTWSCRFFYVVEGEADAEENSATGTFTVRFAEGASEVTSIEASLADGTPFGSAALAA